MKQETATGSVRPRRPTARRQLALAVDIALGTALLVVAVVVFRGLVQRRASSGDDFGWVSLVVVPAVGAIAALLRSDGWRPAIWSVCLTLPMMILLFLHALIIDPPTSGANLWFLGEAILLAHGALTYLVAVTALRIRYVHFR